MATLGFLSPATQTLLFVMLLLADVKLLEEFLRFFKLCPVDPYDERILSF